MLQETQKARNRCNYNNDLHIIGSHNRVGEYGALSIADSFLVLSLYIDVTRDYRNYC